ncbi:MFS transporter, SP family, general alpha glucoside:H+ symporter [Sporothrix schenckii 1099-18]|uniref:Major facilitator superfamily (MFS) profile domain-containing protein n=2 Tax=Sporothrix schenckii TaxID=29908 RepID=U7PJ85_SPOS1|nr:MFS transporter, SP family, general alpha glucoside:H+ symporter [Sporothrix schenckii 1099-18]ERS95708.1 hypothetical protein HMPREF1624_07783 [Sporothrix schenckii ATCC 58251]KJR83725.1 MFS transporter, SP family, general alpha glucoside:H+ symporter [Sporothrix schenckii 1099-18]
MEMTDTKNPPPPPAAANAANAWVGLAGLNADARDATEAEHSMTLGRALRQYPKACFWSVVVSLVVIMDGYDTALIGTLFGFPAFQQRFGVAVPHSATGFQVQAKWQTALGLASPLGNLVGIALNGVCTERWGHKRTLLGAMAWLTACIFIAFFAPSVGVLFVGELLCGVSWGIYTTLATAYASEVTPVVLRAYLETFVVLCWGIGQFISYGVLDGLTGNTTQWAWRIPFAVQWAFPVVIVPLVVFAPESPWWLVRQGRLADAERSVRRLTTAPPGTSASASDYMAVTARNAVALMVETTQLERAMTEGAAWLDCFRGTNLWRTEISCVAWLSQVLVGFAITSYATFFFEQAGLPAADAYKLTVGLGGLHFLCNLASTLLTARHGRRPIFMAGALCMGLIMLVIGFLSVAQDARGGSARSYGFAGAAFYFLWYACYQLTVGPMAFIIVAETSSTRLRSKTIALARNTYNVGVICSSTVAPYVLGSTEGNWKGKSGFLAAGFALLILVWSYFRLPECKGRTYEELDVLFAKNLRARDFASYKFDRELDVERKMGDAEHIE